MVNTLRLTSIVVVLIASVLLVLVVGPKSVLPAVLAKFALGSDEDVKDALEAPSVTEKLMGQGDRNANQSDVTPPLIKEAEIFADILTPREPVAPPPKPTTRGDRRTRPSIVKPVPTSAKFNLVGTAYSASDPESSFAYIRMADDTHQWVRKGDEVGHLLVKEVRNRSIICWDGHNDVEMVADPTPETANLLEASSTSVAPDDDVAPPPGRPSDGRITGPPTPHPWSPTHPAPTSRSGTDPRERDKMQELVNRLRQSSKPGGVASPEDRAAMMKKLMSDFKASRVSEEEAEDVEDLGRELNEQQQTPPPSNERRPNVRRKLTIPRPPKR